MTGWGRTPLRALGALAGLVTLSSIAGALVTAMVAPALAVTGMAANASVQVFENLPNFIEINQLNERNHIYAKRGGKDVRIATVFSQNREEVGWDEVSQHAKDALLSGEDRRFYEHGGVDLGSVVRAAIGNLASGGITSGASTLTMQLVKNIYIQECLDTGETEEQTVEECIVAAQETSLDRKLREMRLAIQLEKQYSKQEILLAYLNIAGFGGNTYGIEAAAERYFDTNAADLTIAQAASLIAIVQAPGKRDLADPAHYEANTQRRNQILYRMLQDERITQAEYDEAHATPVDDTTVTLKTPQSGCLYANKYGKYWCDYVQHVVAQDDTLTGLGATPEERLANWERGGYRVYTSLNLDLQKVAQDSVRAAAPNSETRMELGAATTSVEAGTGWIITMAQNKAFDNSQEAAKDPRRTAVNFNTDTAYGQSGGFQTGSTFKPLVLLAWLDAGRGLNEVVDGTVKPRPQQLFKNSCVGGYGGEVWPIKNDSGTGRMTVLSATVASVNNAFVEMALKLDMCNIAKIGDSLGIHSANGAPIHQEYVPFMLGLGEDHVAPLTMAAAYAAIANKGVYCKPIGVTRFIDPAGEEHEGQKPECSKSLVKPEVAAAAIYAMGQAFNNYGANPWDGVPMFGKTGSTTDFQQTWVMGVSSKVATATWVGNIKGKVPTTRYGYSQTRHAVARPILAAINRVYGGDPFPRPEPRFMTGANAPRIPDVIGSSPEGATAGLEAAGLNVVRGGEVDSELPKGVVAATNPAPGTRLALGSTVTFYTSNGKLIGRPLPDVASGSLSYEEAKAVLGNAGFGNVSAVCVPVKTEGEEPPDPEQLGKVVSMSPGPGSKAKPSQAVKLGVTQEKC
jgi:membrane peptidoglycan carboxypeptidase